MIRTRYGKRKFVHEPVRPYLVRLGKEAQKRHQAAKGNPATAMRPVSETPPNQAHMARRQNVKALAHGLFGLKEP